MATRDQMLAARGRRMVRFNTRLEWFGRRVMNNVNIGVVARLKATAQLLKDRVKINISIPVVKVKSPRTGRIIVTERSKPGEFPRADTTRLMNDIFWEVDERLRTARVGTTLDYGLYLELYMNRSFLRRTLNEIAPQLGVIIASGGGGPVGPLPGQDA
jgi:hypothetical protein